jgi:chemotaxis protein MotB
MMNLNRADREGDEGAYWPGFVDALTTLVLAIVFLLTIFVVMHFLSTEQASSKDQVLARLNAQLVELTGLYNNEKSEKTQREQEVSALQGNVSSLQGNVSSLQGEINSLRSQVAGQTAQVVSERNVATAARNQVEALTQQVKELRSQMAALQDVLEASETSERRSQATIEDLNRRLNLALAEKVKELNRYRSEFFGRLREVIGNRSDIRIVGDRFVFQSELLFEPGKAALTPSGIKEIDKLVPALLQLEREIPSDIAWVLRVDGHTDRRPLLPSAQFKTNWELSSARAIAVVQVLIERGVSPGRLLAGGFGEFHPIDAGETPEALRRNRRIEFKLTER